MANENPDFVLMKRRNSSGSQKWMSPLGQAISTNKMLLLSVEFELWITIHMLPFLQTDS